MHAIESGSCRPQTCGTSELAGTRGRGGFRGTSQDRADQLIRATVFGDLGQKGPASGLKGIAEAIRKELSGADVTGTDVPDDVLNKIEQSLKKAAQALADRGFDAKTIDATVDRFRSQLADALDAIGGNAGSPATDASPEASTGTPVPSTSPPASTDVTSVDQFVAREVRKQRASIDILTAEGDQVSIRLRTKEVLSGSITKTTAADGTTTTETSAKLISRGRLQIEVNGDLNEEELAAIGNLLTKVDEIATRFFSGDVQAAFAAAAELGVDSEQIASYQLDLTYSRKLAAAAWSAARAGLSTPAPSTQTPAIPSTTGTASGAPISGADSTSSAGAPASDVTAPDSSASNASDGTTTPVTELTPSTPSPATARQTIAAFIGDVLSKLGSVDGAGRFSFSMRWKVNVLVTALEALKPAAATTPAPTNPATTPGITPAGGDPAAASTQLLVDALSKAVT